MFENQRSHLSVKKLCFLPTKHDHVFLMIHTIDSDCSLHSINQLVFTMDIDCNLCEIRIDFLCINYMKVNPRSFTFHLILSSKVQIF